MMDSFSFLTNRQNKTSIAPRKIKPIHNLNNYHNDSSRPFTTSLGRTQNIYGYRNINNVEEELNQTCGEEMSSYVAEKIRKISRKHNEIVPLDETINTNLTILSN